MDSSGSKDELIDEINGVLKNQVLAPWYPRVIDKEMGGYLTSFSYKWDLLDNQDKSLVQQCRHIYSTSSIFLNNNDSTYLDYAKHGFNFVKTKMWDKKCGGFFAKVTRNGEPVILENIAVKSAYSNAFAIYGFSLFYKATKNPEALEFAQQTFNWLEQHSYDSKFGGYIDQLNQDGSWRQNRFIDESQKNLSGAMLKDQNSTIHLLEAFSELYKIWPDSLVKERLEELLATICNKITTKNGNMILYFERDWTPLSLREQSKTYRENNQFYDHVSFGHDIETAYLILEAQQALNKPFDPKILSQVKKMVDHSIAWGWDSEFGGLFYAGWYNDSFDDMTIIEYKKAWWPQAESLNSLLLMSKLFPSEKKYYNLFIEQWKQIKSYQVDFENGGWYEDGMDRNPEKIKYPKAHEWKTTYHVLRSLINCIKLLKDEHELINNS